MSNVFYLRPIDPPLASADLDAMARFAEGCFDLHRVEWRHSFLACDGSRMLCWYRAPDAESVRLALRQLGSDMTAVWPGNVIGDDGAGPSLSDAGMLAEFGFEEAQRADDVMTRIGGSATLRRHGVAFVRGFISASGMWMACVFKSEDETRLRAALEEVDLPAHSIWKCTPLAPKAATRDHGT